MTSGDRAADTEEKYGRKGEEETKEEERKGKKWRKLSRGNVPESSAAREQRGGGKVWKI